MSSIRKFMRLVCSFVAYYMLGKDESFGKELCLAKTNGDKESGKALTLVRSHMDSFPFDKAPVVTTSALGLSGIDPFWSNFVSYLSRMFLVEREYNRKNLREGDVIQYVWILQYSSSGYRELDLLCCKHC